MRPVPALDGLRGVAILAVMAFHCGLPFAPGGSLGVDIFFVLSGWLITAILIGEVEATGAVDYRSFLIRRARRLLPGLTFLLILYVLLAPILLPADAGRRWFDAATAFFYLTDLRQTFWPTDTPLNHSWSLAVEGQFYLVWPFVVIALARLPRQRAAVILVTAVAGITICRSLLQAAVGGPAPYYFPLFHSTGLLVGAALAFRPIEIRRGGLALAGMIVLMAVVDTHVWFAAVQPIAEIATALVIADPPRLLGAKPMRFLGRISYGVYLWHIPLLCVMRPDTLPQIAAYILASLIAGYVSHVAIEQRFRQLRPATGGDSAPIIPDTPIPA